LRQEPGREYMLRQGLRGTREEAAEALEYLEKDELSLTPALLQELLCLLQEREKDLHMRAAVLVARKAPEYLAENPHITHLLAGLAQWPSEAELRYELIIALAAIPEKKQQFNLPLCPDRDKVVSYLKRQSETGALLSFLQVSFYRWQPEMDGTSDLKWMLQVLGTCLEGTQDARAKMTLGSGEARQLFLSRALLDVIADEAYEAAANSMVSCLRGPGGDHRLEEMEEYLSDPRLGSKVLEILAHSPGSLALTVEDGIPGWCRPAECTPEVMRKICLGIRAADQALETLVNQYHNLATKDETAARECHKILEPVIDRLSFYLPLK